MGCVYSRIEKEETVRRCRERKRLMKQLVSCRGEFSAALLAYLQSLRNAGATLRQFTEDGSVIPGAAPFGIALPHSPLPLPPSPPPPPPFSPDQSKEEGEEDEDEEVKEALPLPPTREECIDIDGDDNSSCTPPPPSVHSSAWEFWDPFVPVSSSNSSSPIALQKDSTISQTAEEENWAETNTEFEEEEGEVSGVVADVTLKPVKKSPAREVLVDDNSSAVSWFTKDTEMAMVVWRSRKTVAGIVKELDDYFLKASAAGIKVAALLDSNRGNCLHRIFEETKRKSYKSAKVFSSLSWRWSSRSPQSSRDELQGTADACRTVSHCTTLDKLYSEEQRLYKEVKEEETTKLQHKKKTLLLHKQEARSENMMKTEKTRSGIEELESKIMSLQESINRTCLSLSKLRNEELLPQLVELSSGLRQMWRTMYECHQVQNHIAQQMNHLQNQSSTEPTTDSHRHATVQLETEVTSWYNAFCNLMRSQREYVRILNLWVRLTDCLPDNGELMGSSSGIYSLCEEWQLALNRLPDKVAAEAIKSFLSVIHSIGLQLAEEHSLQRKSERLEKRLDKELNPIREMEKKYSDNYDEDWVSSQRSDLNPSSIKNVKLEAFKKRVEEEKLKYHNSVCMSRAMTLNNLQTSLPNVFQALMGFSSVCMQAFEGIHGSSEPTMGHLSGSSPF